MQGSDTITKRLSAKSLQHPDCFKQPGCFSEEGAHFLDPRLRGDDGMAEPRPFAGAGLIAGTNVGPLREEDSTISTLC